MRLRLAYGVVADPGSAAWLPRPGGAPVRLSAQDDAPPGAAVALGPADADDATVRRAAAELAGLVRDGGVTAAGAGVALGGGFRSARLDGARGDLRDAVFAALRVLGVAGSGRLGERTGFLAGLFGPAVTRRVGAAAARAIEEGRWSALHLAVAASDVLGPERLERILALQEPGGADLIAGGRPSVLAADLRRVLEPVPRPRRLDLLLDLWERVAAHHAMLARRERRMASQSPRDRLPHLIERRARFEDEVLLSYLTAEMGEDVSLVEAARWQPREHYWHGLLTRVLDDALAATALLRTAVAVADHGLAEGAARSESILRAVDRRLAVTIYQWPSWREPTWIGLPGRPGGHVRELVTKLDAAKERPDDAKVAAYFRERLARAHDYGRLAVKTVADILSSEVEVPDAELRWWASQSLAAWRAQVGYSPVRGPEDWVDEPSWAHRLLGTREPLAVRLARLDDPAPGAVEEVGDLLWCADLVDALAALYGHDRAETLPEEGPPWLDPDPMPDGTDPMTPRYGSIASAVSAAAQLSALGSWRYRRGVRTWEAFTADLVAAVEVSEALAGEFSVPAPLAALDGTVVPGTGGAVFRVARTARTLAEWANYMGNCIASPAYLEDAQAGRCGLAALCGRDGRILVNLELAPRKPEARGWRITEMAARFNDDPEEELARRIRDWVATIPALDRSPASAAPGAAAEEDEGAAAAPARPLRTGGRRPRPRLLRDAGGPLGELAERAWADAAGAETVRVLAALTSGPASRSAGAPPAGSTAPEEAFALLTRLRRLRPASLDAACRNALDRHDVDLADLWALSGTRPMETALDGLDPALRERFGRLDLLTGTGPLPGSLRTLARSPQVAPAYTMNLVGLRLRAAIGRLVLDGDQALARSVARRPTVPMLCALVVHANAAAASSPDLVPVTEPRAVTVPGFPASTLEDEDGPWRRALPDARELGADTDAFWAGIAEHGLRVPVAWVSRGGWTGLWSRAHHHSRDRRRR